MLTWGWWTCLVLLEIGWVKSGLGINDELQCVGGALVGRSRGERNDRKSM